MYPRDVRRCCDVNTQVDLTRIAVLAVDDIEDNIDLLQDMLEDEVWSFIRACSGEEAISLATEHRPDVVLLDLMMPRMNGLAVVRAFRGVEALRQTAVIVQTAYADRDAVLAAKRLGCNHILTKPVERERLLAQIRSCLEARADCAVPAVESSESKTEPAPGMGLTQLLEDARRLVEVEDLAEEATDLDREAHAIGDDVLRHLISSEGPIGRKLMKVANSPAYPARYPARNITEAIVRIGIRETKELIRKAATAPQARQSTSRTVKALDLLEGLVLLFPDRTATSEGMLALLEDLNRASDPAVDAFCASAMDEQARQAPARAGQSA